MSTDRSTVWTSVCYPDSLPDNWMQVVNNLHIPCAVSPLHDKDVNGDETEKKSHYHFMFQFDSLKSFSQVKELICPLNGTIPQVVHSPRSLVRYFTHKDNPEKKPYDEKDILSFCGIDVQSFDDWTTSKKILCLKQMVTFIDNNDIHEFSVLVNHSMKVELDWFYMLTQCSTVFIKTYIDSKRYSLKNDVSALKDQRSALFKEMCELSDKIQKKKEKLNE